MYLSRLILNPRSRRVQRELARPYQMHRTVMRAFPANLQPGEERVLWRIDEDPALGLTLLVQSLQQPEWGWLAADGARDYLLQVDVRNPAIKPFELVLRAGQTLAFRLRANPTKRLTVGKGSTGKRVGIYTEADQLAWLQRKGEQHGFCVLEARLRSDGKVKDEHAIHKGDETHTLEVLSVQFDGLLQVSDPDRLTAAVQTGVGSGKGFGFGLLSLAPPLGS